MFAPMSTGKDTWTAEDLDKAASAAAAHHHPPPIVAPTTSMAVHAKGKAKSHQPPSAIDAQQHLLVHPAAAAAARGAASAAAVPADLGGKARSKAVGAGAGRTGGAQGRNRAAGGVGAGGTEGGAAAGLSRGARALARALSPPPDAAQRQRAAGGRRRGAAVGAATHGHRAALRDQYGGAYYGGVLDASSRYGLGGSRDVLGASASSSAAAAGAAGVRPAAPGDRFPAASPYWEEDEDFFDDPALSGHRERSRALPGGGRARRVGWPGHTKAPGVDGSLLSPHAALRAAPAGDAASSGSRPPSKRRPLWKNLFRPDVETAHVWLDSWWLRWIIMAGVPSLIVWFWCAVPFPKRDPYDATAPWCDDVGSDAPWCRPRDAATPPTGALASSPPGLATLAAAVRTTLTGLSRGTWAAGEGPMAGPAEFDANFWFFLVFYFGIYCAVGLIYITQLFSLYRLNWWPSALGAKKSYFSFWILSLCAGYALHAMRFDGPTWWRGGRGEGERAAGTRDSGHGGIGDVWEGRPGSNGAEDNVQWQRKTLWVGLAFATMAMPALVCLAGLRRSGRQTYRHSLTDMQKTFLERQLARRIPASYTRFLWFMATIGLALVALLAGQGYASVYLRTLPHTGLDGTAYVLFWTTNVNVLLLVSSWILEEKVRSRALLFVFKYYFFLVYFVFYRNLFARLRSFDQFALVQLLSSFWVCIWYPFSMTSICHRFVQYFNPDPKSWEEYVESVGLAFYLRNLAQNTTMLAFLGWLSILHFGPNQHLYPYFAFEDERDPYNYQLTMLGSLAIWGSELVSSFVARQICLHAFGVDVTNLGLDEMREYPELVTSVLWASVHVLQDMLLFLVKLNFR